MASRRPVSTRSRAAWSRRVESQSLTIPAALLREARANTKHVSKDVAFLWALAREIALTRGRELTLAHRSLVWMMPGFRTRQGARGARVTSELCIVFVVRRKRTLDPRSPEHLPRSLITYAEHGGRRQPFAIPTDVQDVSAYHRAFAQADGAVWTDRSGWVAEPGHFAAMINLRQADSQQRCILGAQHVFTPFADGSSMRVEGSLTVRPLDAFGRLAQLPRLAVSLPVGGLLRDDERPDRPSFDVQLASVPPEAEAEVRSRTPLRGISQTDPWVRSMAQVLHLDAIGWFYMITPDNHSRAPRRGLIRLTLGSMPPQPFPIAYKFRSGGQVVVKDVYHEELLCLRATNKHRPPLRGDSGSPIVARRDDGSFSLVAMHIAGDEEGLSWAIPAWLLFDMGHWEQYPEGAEIELIEP